jgi:hypothetical protein
MLTGKGEARFLPVVHFAFSSYLAFSGLKGIVQRILRGVEIGIKKSVLVNWRPGRFSF